MKLYFYYGVMGSSKTANALMKKFSFEERGKRVLLMKPSLDTRSGKTIIKSRVGLSSEAIVIESNSKIRDLVISHKKLNNPEIIIIDEAQFLTENQVDELREMADNNIMIMCYGLKTDFTGRLFPGTKRILEICDTVREIQCMCTKCGTKAIMNAKYCNNKIIYTGDIIDIGGDEKYIPLCHKCWTLGEI